MNGKVKSDINFMELTNHQDFLACGQSEYFSERPELFKGKNILNSMNVLSWYFKE